MNARFVAQRLDDLLDEPRPSAPRTVTDATIERVVSGSPSHIRLSYATGIEKIMRGFGSNGNGPEETDIP